MSREAHCSCSSGPLLKPSPYESWFQQYVVFARLSGEPCMTLCNLTYTVGTAEKGTERLVPFYFFQRKRKIKPASCLVSYLEFHRLPFGCSLCNLSRHLQENHNRIIFLHTEGTIEAATLKTEARASLQLLPACEMPARTQKLGPNKR